MRHFSLRTVGIVCLLVLLWGIFFSMILSPVAVAPVCGNGEVKGISKDPIPGQLRTLNPSTTRGAMESENVRTQLVDKNGLYIGYAKKQKHNLQLFNGVSFENCGSYLVPIESHVNKIFSAPGFGGLWVCTDWVDDQGGGIYRFDQGKWQVYSTKEGLPAQQCYDIQLVGISGSVIAGTWNGFSAFSANHNRWEFPLGLNAPGGVVNIDTFWILPNAGEGFRHIYGTIGTGLYELRATKTGEFMWAHHTVDVHPELGSDSSRKIVQDPLHPNLLWIISDPGVATYDYVSRKWTAVTGIPSIAGTDLVFDRFNRPWIATHQGVFMQDCGKWRLMNPGAEDSLSIVFGTKESPFGPEAFFIGTSTTGVLMGAIPARATCA